MSSDEINVHVTSTEEERIFLQLISKQCAELQALCMEALLKEDDGKSTINNFMALREVSDKAEELLLTLAVADEKSPNLKLKLEDAPLDNHLRFFDLVFGSYFKKNIKTGEIS